MNNNVFQEVKELLDPRNVVADILGEPAKTSGDNWYWHSPFKDGDNDPSFCVSPNEISDFSGTEFGNGNDICNFIVKYNDLTHCITASKMNNYDALQYLNDKYNLDLDLSKNNIVKSDKTTNKNTKIQYSLQVKEKSVLVSAYGVYAYFDGEEFKQKPQNKEIGKIKNRIDINEAGNWPVEDIKKML